MQRKQRVCQSKSFWVKANQKNWNKTCKCGFDSLVDLFQIHNWENNFIKFVRWENDVIFLPSSTYSFTFPLETKKAWIHSSCYSYFYLNCVWLPSRTVVFKQSHLIYPLDVDYVEFIYTMAFIRKANKMSRYSWST